MHGKGHELVLGLRGRRDTERRGRQLGVELGLGRLRVEVRRELGREGVERRRRSSVRGHAGIG